MVVQTQTIARYSRWYAVGWTRGALSLDNLHDHRIITMDVMEWHVAREYLYSFLLQSQILNLDKTTPHLIYYTAKSINITLSAYVHAILSIQQFRCFEK